MARRSTVEANASPGPSGSRSTHLQPPCNGSAGIQIHCATSGDHTVPVDGGPARDLRAAAVTVDLDAAAHRPFRHRPLARRPRAARRGDPIVLFPERIPKINILRKGACFRALALRDLWVGRHREPGSPQRAVHRCLSEVTRSAKPRFAWPMRTVLNALVNWIGAPLPRRVRSSTSEVIRRGRRVPDV